MRGRSVPTLAGRVLGVFAVFAVISSLSIGVRRLLHVPFQYVNSYIALAPDTSLAWALVLALLAAAMTARKRVAWWVTVVFLILFITGNVLNILSPDLTAWELGNMIFGLVLQIVTLAVLIYAYPSFNTRVRAGAGFKALAVLVVGLAVGTLLGWGLVELLPRTLDPSQRLAYAINRVVLLSSVDADLFDGNRSYSIVNVALGFLGAMALILAVIVLFRSQRSSNALTGLDESAIRGLLAEHGQDDSLGYFATRRDKAVIFSTSGDAAIAYRVEVGVCLASGDPIGPREAWAGVIERWTEQCQQFGWTPAVMGASEDGATAYRAAGLQALELGDEAILYTDEFTLSGPEMRGARQAVSRARRAGVTVRMRRHHTLTEAEMADVVARAEAWRDTDDERGFSMALGRLGDRLDGDCVLVEAVTGEGTADERVIALLSLVPWGSNGISLDLMRRDRQAPNGVVELMVSEMCVRARELSINRISLNFAVFRSVFEEGGRIGAGPVLRLWRGLLLFLSRWWQLEALYRSNVKYHPSWQARYICFDDTRLLARVGMASGIAEGYVMMPSPRWRRSGPDPMTVHTGIHPAVPAALVGSAGLHTDGSAPDQPARQDDSSTRRPEQVRVRLAKLASLAEAGVDAYPDADAPSHSVAQACDAADDATVHVAGRILRIRDYGAVAFIDLRDWTGDVQLIVEPEKLSDSMDFVSTTDIGDLVDVSGVVGYSRNGTRSILVRRWRLNAKCLHPLPEKWKGLTDPEAKVRMRYVDLAVDVTAQQTVRARAAVLTAMRMFLVERGFLEVETPILQRIHGGANATPFRTHINAYGLDLYLRIAPELYLKRLCVGGIEKVFELGRTFRNEGVDFSHNPEFSILEAYQAHSDYLAMLDLTRELIQAAAVAAYGEAVAIRIDDNGERHRVDISGQWPVVSMFDAVSAAVQTTVTSQSSVDELRAICDSHGIEYQADWDAGHVALEMYEHLVEGATTRPTFYKDFPTSVSPLTKASPDDPGVAQRWDLVAWGVELGTAYSELTDPVEQRRRLTEQSLLAAGGDPEAMELDEDFLRALEYGMPPTGGLGIGVDRIVMLITGLSIRESLPFPLVKPRESEAG